MDAARDAVESVLETASDHVPRYVLYGAYGTNLASNDRGGIDRLGLYLDAAGIPNGEIERIGGIRMSGVAIYAALRSLRWQPVNKADWASGGVFVEPTGDVNDITYFSLYRMPLKWFLMIMLDECHIDPRKYEETVRILIDRWHVLEQERKLDLSNQLYGRMLLFRGRTPTRPDKQREDIVCFTAPWTLRDVHQNSDVAESMLNERPSRWFYDEKPCEPFFNPLNYRYARVMTEGLMHLGMDENTAIRYVVGIRGNVSPGSPEYIAGSSVTIKEYKSTIQSLAIQDCVPTVSP